MKAVVYRGYVRAEDIHLEEVPVPVVVPGWVLIRVQAFGLNRSEVTLRTVEAGAPYLEYPLIPGIECAGEVVDPSDSGWAKGQKVVAFMGGLGRSFDGSYAEFALTPIHHTFPVSTSLTWRELAAFPETYFTAWGSLFHGLRLVPGDSLLIRGATSATGLAAAQLAMSLGCTVAGTTRKPERLEGLARQGIRAFLDDVSLDGALHRQYPEGFSKVLELVGPKTLAQSMEWVSFHGIVCCTGALGHQFGIEWFDPIKMLPDGVALTSFYSNNPTPAVVNSMLSHLEGHGLRPLVSRIFPFASIAEAHRLMESDASFGKIVIEVS